MQYDQPYALYNYARKRGFVHLLNTQARQQQTKF